MASFEKRPSGWRVKVRYQGRGESATFRTKAEAQAWATEREVEMRSVAAGGIPKRTLRQALERYRDDESPKRRGKRWEQLRIEAFLRDMNFVDWKLADVTTATLAGWRDSRMKEVKPGTVLRELNLLNSILAIAVREWRWLKENPLTAVKRPPEPAPRKRKYDQAETDCVCIALGFDETQAVVTASQQVAVAFLVALETAMRQGEILGLTCGHVDYDARVAHLPQTKNGLARDVPLSSRAVALLKLLPAREDGRLFGISGAVCDASFRRARIKSGVEGATFHDARRTALTRLAKIFGVLDLAKISGHKDLKMLSEVYYAPTASDLAQMMD